MTSDHDDGRGVSRRRILECMTWAGTGVLWTLAGGVPQSIGIIGEATAAEPSGLTFLQISDSHVGFDKAANTQRDRYAGRSDQQNPVHADQAVLHHSYR